MGKLTVEAWARELQAVERLREAAIRFADRGDLASIESLKAASRAYHAAAHEALDAVLGEIQDVATPAQRARVDKLLPKVDLRIVRE